MFSILFYILVLQKKQILAFTKPHDDWNNQPRNNLLLQTEKPTMKPKGDWRQTSTGGFISNSMKYRQLPLIRRGIQHLKKRRGHFCATEPWPVNEYPQAVPAAVRRRQELHPDRTGPRCYFVTKVALKVLRIGWHTFGLDSAFIFFSTASRNSLTELHLLAVQGKDRDAEQPSQESRCSSHFHKHCTFPTFLL